MMGTEEWEWGYQLHVELFFLDYNIWSRLTDYKTNHDHMPVEEPGYGDSILHYTTIINFAQELDTYVWH